MKLRRLVSLLLATLSIGVVVPVSIAATKSEPTMVSADESTPITLEQIIITYNDDRAYCNVFINGEQKAKADLSNLTAYQDKPNTVIAIHFTSKEYNNNAGYYWKISAETSQFAGLATISDSSAVISKTISEINSANKGNKILTITCACEPPHFTIWTRIERLIDTNVGAILIAIITMLLLLFSRVIVRVYNMGRNSKAELVSKSDFDEYKVEQANLIAVNKADTQNTLVLLTKQMIDNKLGNASNIIKNAENVAEYQTELRIKLKSVDALTEATAENSKSIRRLEQRVDTIQYPSEGTGRRTDKN